MQREQYRPALTMMLQQQQQEQQYQQQQQRLHGTPTTVLSPYRNPQAARGLGRQQSAAQQLRQAKAKGMARSASAANMPTAQRLAPLAHKPTVGQQTSQQQQQVQQIQAHEPPPPEMWQSDASHGRLEQQQQQQHQQQQQQPLRQMRSSASLGVLVAARPGESLEAQAYRSMPAHAYAGSHFYSAAPSQAQRMVHTHQYPDGSIVEECACERGRPVAQRQQNEEKEQAQQQHAPSQASLDGAAAPLRLTPSQLARADLGYERRARPADTSRQHSVYASQFKVPALQAFSKMGRGYFASHNKSYVRSCLQDPGYGFHLEALRTQAQNDPDLTHYAAEIKREHVDPSRRLSNVISPVNLPDTTHHKDYAAPSADLIRGYKRVGKDYRQAGNKSYIRLNLVDPAVAAQPSLLGVSGFGTGGVGGADVSSSTPSVGIRVPFTATTTHSASYQDFTEHIPRLRASRAKAIRFGSETGPHENIWQGQWDDNMD